MACGTNGGLIVGDAGDGGLHACSFYSDLGFRMLVMNL